MIRYIIIFFIFSIIGWIYEYIVFNRNKPDGVSEKLFDMKFPILPIYGLGGIILLFIYDTFNEYTLLQKVLISVLLINIMECLVGCLSYRFYGYQTWKYSDDMIPVCYGYISVYSGLVWLIGSFMFFGILDKLTY